MSWQERPWFLLALPTVDRNTDLWNISRLASAQLFQAGKLLIYIHTAKHVLVEVFFFRDENHNCQTWIRKIHRIHQWFHLGHPNLKRITRHSCFLQNLRGGTLYMGWNRPFNTTEIYRMATKMMLKKQQYQPSTPQRWILSAVMNSNSRCILPCACHEPSSALQARVGL